MNGSCVPTDSGTDRFPEHIAGVDLPLGLELLSGNRSLYLIMLGKFLEGHKDTAAAIRRALAANEWGVAELIAHGTKGVSGCIGATALQKCAADLERAIVTQSYEMDSLLHRFEVALDEVMSDLQNKLPPE